LELGYNFLHCFFYLFYRALFAARAVNKENVPNKGGVIIAANHLSNWDPMLISCFIKRPVGYMAKQELFDVPLLGSALRTFHSFPVRRGTVDRTAIKTAINKLVSGECMGVFPEVHRSKTGELQQAATGVALIAAKAAVPVIPTAVINTNKIFGSGSFFPKICVAYGKPIYYTSASTNRAELQKFTDMIMHEIQNLINSCKT
jgi:1-acyl-sn-glycerol-3-phosphate acyltransferase